MEPDESHTYISEPSNGPKTSSSSEKSPTTGEEFNNVQLGLNQISPPVGSISELGTKKEIDGESDVSHLVPGSSSSNVNPEHKRANNRHRNPRLRLAVAERFRNDLELEAEQRSTFAAIARDYGTSYGYVWSIGKKQLHDSKEWVDRTRAELEKIIQDCIKEIQVTSSEAQSGSSGNTHVTSTDVLSQSFGMTTGQAQQTQFVPIQSTSTSSTQTDPSSTEDFRPNCPYCGQSMLRAGIQYYKNSYSRKFTCYNKKCESYNEHSKKGISVFFNPFLHGSLVSLEQRSKSSKRFSNKVSPDVANKLYEAFYVDGRSARKAVKEINEKYGLKIHYTTALDIIQRVGKRTKADYVGEDSVRHALTSGLLGFQYGTTRYNYLVVDATEYRFRDRKTGETRIVWVYLAIDYGSKIILDYSISSERFSNITRTLLEHVMSWGYIPDVIISDKGTDVVPAIAQVITEHPNIKNFWCSKHRRDNINQDLIVPDERDPRLKLLRRHYGYVLFGALNCIDKAMLSRTLELLEAERVIWSQDVKAKKCVDSFIKEVEHYSGVFDYPGCPRTTNSIEGLFGHKDRRRRNQELGKSHSKWLLHLVNLINIYNRKRIEKKKDFQG